MRWYFDHYKYKIHIWARCRSQFLSSFSCILSWKNPGRFFIAFITNTFNSLQLGENQLPLIQWTPHGNLRRLPFQILVLTTCQQPTHLLPVKIKDLPIIRLQAGGSPFLLLSGTSMYKTTKLLVRIYASPSYWMNNKATHSLQIPWEVKWSAIIHDSLSIFRLLPWKV